MIRLSRVEALVLGVADLGLVSTSFALAYVLRFHLGVGAVVDVPAPPPGRYLEALPVVLAVFHLVLRSRGLYERWPPRGFDVVEHTLRAVTFASVLVLAASFFSRDEGFDYSRSVVLLGWALCCAAVPLPRLLALARRRRRYARGLDLVPAVIVGAAPRSLDLLARLRAHRRYGLDVRGVVTTAGDAPAAQGEPPAVLGTIADLPGVLRRTGAREVLVSDTLERRALFEVLEACEGLGVEARVVPCLYDLFVVSADLTELFGVPFISIRERRFVWLYRLVKRAGDLVLGGILLGLALPLLALLAWRVRRESAGPAFFVQRRVGEGGRVFRMWKLRSMVSDAEARLHELVDVGGLAQPVFKLRDDPRVTPLGRLLRRWSLDELPQLWNVVRGDMSLVGPRPEEEAVVARYDAHQRRRLKAKPGLTGLQQVEARASTDLDERIRLDVFYIRRRTLLFDLWILLRTPWAVLHGRGAT